MNATSVLLLVFLVSTSLVVNLSETRRAKQIPSSVDHSHILVMGFVFCDICSNNTFSKHSYYLPGAEVKVDCMFKAVSPRTAEQITVSVNRTTNRHGVYRLEIPAIDGIRCAEESAMASSCRASLLRSSSSSCNVPGLRDTSDQISVKSKRDNLCVYSFNALNYRPSKTHNSLCASKKI